MSCFPFRPGIAARLLIGYSRWPPVMPEPAPPPELVLLPDRLPVVLGAGLPPVGFPLPPPPLPALGVAPVEPFLSEPFATPAEPLGAFVLPCDDPFDDAAATDVFDETEPAIPLTGTLRAASEIALATDVAAEEPVIGDVT